MLNERLPESGISIHAPLTGSDTGRDSAECAARHFNPRSPHGERQMKLDNKVYDILFQSTLPSRGATGA